MIKILLILTLAITVIATTPQFDFFIFSQFWIPSVFNSPYILPPYSLENSFSIHGLWPNFNNGSYPQYCNRSNSFDPSQLDYLIPELSESWWNPDEGGNQILWSHEWMRHGTCSNMTEYSYFNSTVNLWKNFNYLPLLEYKYIFPNNNQTYLPAVLTVFLESFFGKQTIIINCDTIKIGNSVYEILICLDKTLKVQECPLEYYKKAQTETFCQKTVFLPLLKL